MSLSRTFKRALITTLPLVALAAPQAFGQNVQAMAKWTALTIVRYRVVGEFSGTTPILSGTKSKLVRSAPVTDRVELDFDWNQQEMKLVGTPVIRNFPSKVGAIPPISGCTQRVDGPMEFATVLAMANGPMHMSGVVELTIKRDQPAGSACWLSEEGVVWEAAPAKSETTMAPFTVALAMALAMPGMIPATPDGKSLVMKTADGWTWTHTPTPVK